MSDGEEELRELGKSLRSLEVVADGARNLERGRKPQSLEDVSDGDEELRELGENLQCLEGVADGARNLEHGGDLGELKDNGQVP